MSGDDDGSIPPPPVFDALPDFDPDAVAEAIVEGDEAGAEESAAVEEKGKDNEGEKKPEVAESFVSTKEPEPWELAEPAPTDSDWDHDEFDGEGLESPEDEEDEEDLSTDDEYEYDDEDYGEGGLFVPGPEVEDEATFNMRMDLVNSYLLKKALLKYVKKKNAYFQDRIYKTSIRKGVLIEEKTKEGKDGKKKTRKEPKKKKDKSYGADVEVRKKPEEEDTEEETALVEIDFTKRKSLLALLSPKTIAEKAERDRRAKQQKLQRSFGENFRNEAKYQKVVRKIIRILEQVGIYENQHLINLDRHALRREEWRVAHKKQLDSILNMMRNASEDARDSNTGKRMKRNETEGFCRDITASHRKLCSTMIKMYKCRRGLELSRKRLAESEIQGEGLQMLEYEQLRSENQILKDKLSDRLKDVDNIKQKITHGIQILAHFRSKLFCINQLIGEGKVELGGINEEVYSERDHADDIIRNYQLVKLEQQKLIVESGLLDNPALLRDYEKSHFEFMTLGDEKRKLIRELNHGNKEIADIHDRISDIKAEFPLSMASPEELSKIKRDVVRRKTLFAPVNEEGTLDLPDESAITDADLISDPKMMSFICKTTD